MVTELTRRDRRRRRTAKTFWRMVNPVALALAGVAPWWVVLETIGRRTGAPRRVPLARGPMDGTNLWLIAVHGERASFVRNIISNPRIRLRLRETWRIGVATVAPYDGDILSRFNTYARLGPRMLGIEPKLVSIELDRDRRAPR
jgi:deazaflavin-dependent oxidoreductase (nitroreductase family)